MENPGDTRGFFCLVLHVRLRYKCRLIHWVPTKLALLNYGLIQMARWVTHSKDRTLLIPEAIYGEPDPGGMTVTPPEVLVARVEGCRHRWGSDSLAAEPSIKAMSSRKVGLAYASDLSVVSSLPSDPGGKSSSGETWSNNWLSRQMGQDLSHQTRGTIFFAVKDILLTTNNY